jgi:hypothetical protein
MAEIYKIKKSGVSGEGIFAEIDIDSGTNLGVGFEKIGNTGTPDQDYTRTELGEKINHSENPNLELKEEENKFYLITARKIKAGEELFLNYKDIPWQGKSDF